MIILGAGMYLNIFAPNFSVCMTHPLEKYITIADNNYISRLEDEFYTSYCSELEKGLYVQVEKEHSRIKVMGVDLEGNNFSEYMSFSSYFITEYNKLEKETRSNIDNFLFELLDEPKQQLFIKNTIAKLQELHRVIFKLLVDVKHDACKAVLLDKILVFVNVLQAAYQQGKLNISSSNLKLKWLGNVNLLTTLFYDLSQGNKSKNIPALINATPKEIENFILINFIDSNSDPFSQETIKTNLKPSKQKEKRAKGEISIEISKE